MKQKTMTVAQFCQTSGLGKTTTFALIRQGQLEKIKIGRRTLIKASSVEQLLNGSKTRGDE